MSLAGAVRSRFYPDDRRPDFERADYQRRWFFPHRSLLLPRPGPDGYKITERCGLDPEPGELYQVLLYALEPVLDRLTDQLCFDDDIQWHRQHLGRRGLVASASLMIRGTSMYSVGHHSDLVQRIGRLREHRNWVERVFHAWDRLLLNSVLAFARERGVKTVHVPSAPLAMQHTDPTRTVGRSLFDRVYDAHVRDAFVVDRHDDWWSIDVNRNSQRIVQGTPAIERARPGPVVLVCHDIERGLGHSTDEPAFAARAAQVGEASLPTMLEVERDHGFRCTYNVVGVLLDEVKAALMGDEHALGFHTYDHSRRSPRDQVRAAVSRATSGLVAPPSSVPTALQTGRCRAIDPRIKGYRPAQSRLGADTETSTLLRNNFEWLASSQRSLGLSSPGLDKGLVRIPIGMDDFSLHQSLPYPAWHQRLVERAREREFFALSLHDCYADTWLDQYPRVLDLLSARAQVLTMDEVAAAVVLSHAE